MYRFSTAYLKSSLTNFILNCTPDHTPFTSLPYHLVLYSSCYFKKITFLLSPYVLTTNHTFHNVIPPTITALKNPRTGLCLFMSLFRLDWISGLPVIWQEQTMQLQPNICQSYGSLTTLPLLCLINPWVFNFCSCLAKYYSAHTP